MDSWAQLLATGNPTASPHLVIRRQILAACIRFAQHRPDESIQILQSALTLAQDQMLAEEPELRMLLVDLYLRQNRKQDALDVLDGLVAYDQATMMVRELSAVRLATALGNAERASQAVKRLLNVRLSVQRQTALAEVLVKANMPELASELLKRTRHRTSNSLDQLGTLLRYFDDQGQQSEALEVASEVLQRSAPPRHTEASTYRGYSVRAYSLKVLKKAGKLPQIIESLESRFKESPVVNVCDWS